jgi:hypothetical protein
MIGRQIECCCRLSRGLVGLSAVTFALALSLVVVECRADLPISPKLRPLFVDADDPSAWPKDLEPVASPELQRLLATLGGKAGQPPVSQIEEATYRADFQDGRLEKGTADFRVSQRGSSLNLLPLGNPNLTLTHPRWVLGGEITGESNKIERALWGTDSTGRRVLIVEPGRSRLACDWSITGRSLTSATEFRLVLPPAVVSQLFLTVPDDWDVDGSVGVLSTTPNPLRPGKTVCQIDLGGQSTCRLRIGRKSAAEAKTSLFVDQDTAYVVSAEKLQMQSKLQFDAYSKAVSHVSLLAPASLRIETISCTDVPLAFKSQAVKEGQKIEITLPEPVIGRSRAIVVEASAASHIDQMWRLPRIDIPGAIRRDGQAELTIANPLKLQQFGGDTATAQLEAPSYGADGEETFKLRNADFDRPLLIKIGEPPPALTTSMLERLDLRRDQCALRCEVVCAASSGSAFSIECDVPDVWDVTNVQAMGETSRIIHWTSREGAGPGRKRRIKIDFFRAVSERELQRFRLEASSRIPRTGETINLPVLSFPGLRSSELQTIVTHSPAIDLALDPPAEFAPFSPTIIAPAFANSSLLPDSRQSSEERIVVYRKRDANEKARITLRRGEQGYLAHVQATLDVQPPQVNQRIAVSITPQAEPLERVFVYLTTEGSPINWILASERPRPLEAVFVAPSRHSEWNLPVGGELWELRLPEPQHGPFLLEGSRKTDSSNAGAIGLVFLPGARSFSGTVEVRFANARQFLVEALGPQPVKPPERPRSADSRSENRIVRMWSYKRPTDSLVLKMRQSGTPQTAAQVAALELRSSLDFGGAGDDLHRATFVLAPLSGTRPFRFSLSSVARLTSVAVNNDVVRVQRHDDAVTVPSLPAERWNRVDIAYRTSSTLHRLREKRAIVVPRADDAEVYQFRWTFALPPGIVPCRDPSGTELLEQKPALSWTETMFGPLGRPIAESPISSIADAPWMTDFGFESTTRADVFAEIDPERPGPNWSVWHATAQNVPADLMLSVWHEPQMRQFAWVVFFGCLSVGLAFQRFRSRARLRVALTIAALAAVASFAAGGFYSLALGACVAGILLSILTWGPPFVRSARPVSTKREAARPESAVTLENRAILRLIALIAVGVATAQCLASPVGTSPQNARTVDSSFPKVPAELLVVVPTRGGNLSSNQGLFDENRLVYVPRLELDALRQAANQVRQPGENVFLSAQYAVTFDLRQPVVVEARYLVALLTAGETTIRIPLTNVTLAGANACRVNRRSHAIRKTDDGFLLTLNPKEANAGDHLPRLPFDPGQPRPPIRAARPQSKHIVQGGAPKSVFPSDDPDEGRRPRVLEISLSFFPETSGTAPAGFEFGLPRVAGTLLQVLKPGPLVPLSVETEEGGIRKLTAGTVSILDVGETAWLRVAPDSPRVALPSPLEARAVQFVRLSPDVVEMDCRVSYAAVPGGIDSFEWTIPAAAVVRGWDENVQTARGTPSADGRWVPLKFAFAQKMDRPVTLGVRLMIPTKAIPSLGKPPHFMIPLVRFSGGPGSGPVKLSSNQVGVTAVPGYRAVISTNEPNIAHTSAADPAFRQEFRGGGRKEPEFIVETRGLGALPAEVVPLSPSYKVRISDEGRFSGERLVWRTAAEIRVENAPAFVHRLRVDPRLKIESISIQEDNVERLVRYSRSGQDVTLFLRDRAAATQDLVLTGSMPIDVGREMKLPGVSLVGATVSDARLLLEPGPQIDLTVIGSPSPSSALKEEHDDGLPRRTREFLLLPDAPLPLVQVTARSEPPHVESVAVVTPSGSHSVDIEVDLRITGTRGQEESFEVSVPAEIAQHSTIVANVDKHIRQLAAGSIGIRLDARQTIDPILQIRWSQTQTGESWRIPPFSVTNAETKESMILISESLHWRPSSDSRVGMQPATTPDWMRSRLPEGQSFSGWKSSLAGPNAWVLDRGSAGVNRAATARAYVNLCLTADDSVLGSLSLLIEQATEPMLAVRWPRDAMLRSALLDGKPIQPITDSDGRLEFALGPERKVRRLALHWLRSGGHGLGLVSPASEEFPVPLGLELKTVLVEACVPSGFRALAPTGFKSLGPSLFADETRTIVTIADEATNRELLGSEQLLAVPSASQTILRGQLDLDHSFGVIRMWVYREWLVTIPVSLAVFLLVVATLFWLSTSRAADWFAGGHPLVLIVLGAAWWAFLSPRVIGVALVVAALFWFARSRSSVEPRRGGRLPSTLHLPG